MVDGFTRRTARSSAACRLPHTRALRIAAAYAGAGIIPLCPYLLGLPLGSALIASSLVTALALAGFGAVKARYTGAPALRSAVQTLLIGGAAAGTAYLIGRALSSFGR